MNTPLINECIFQFARSGGKGGQHVNKTETKVVLHFNVPNSQILTAQQKEQLTHKLAHRLSQTGNLIIMCQTTRSQLKNKEIVIKKFNTLIEKSLHRQAPRLATKPTKGSKAKNKKTKTINSLIKQWRKPLIIERE
jgi:ribosome-associated protein